MTVFWTRTITVYAYGDIKWPYFWYSVSHANGPTPWLCLRLCSLQRQSRKFRDLFLPARPDITKRCEGKGIESTIAECSTIYVAAAWKYRQSIVESSWNVMAHGDAREGKWRGNWRMEWLASTLHTTSEHCVSSITTADEHTSAASSRLNWRPRWLKWTRSFRRNQISSFCVCHHISNAVYF